MMAQRPLPTVALQPGTTIVLAADPPREKEPGTAPLHASGSMETPRPSRQPVLSSRGARSFNLNTALALPLRAAGPARCLRSQSGPQNQSPVSGNAGFETAKKQPPAEAHRVEHLRDLAVLMRAQAAYSGIAVWSAVIAINSFCTHTTRHRILDRVCKRLGSAVVCGQLDWPAH